MNEKYPLLVSKEELQLMQRLFRWVKSEERLGLPDLAPEVPDFTGVYIARVVSANIPKALSADEPSVGKVFLRRLDFNSLAALGSGTGTGTGSYDPRMIVDGNVNTDIPDNAFYVNAYNTSTDVSYVQGEQVLVLQTSSGGFVILNGGKGETGTTTVASSCGCTCVDAGDIMWKGVPTTSKRYLFWGSEVFYVPNGYITVEAGFGDLIFDAGADQYELDVGDFMIANYHDGVDATSNSVLEGKFTYTWGGPGTKGYITLCIDGSSISLPPEEDPPLEV